jgi:phosphomannomutase
LIGGKVGDNPTPVDAVKFAAAYGTCKKKYSNKDKLTVVVGRDV